MSPIKFEGVPNLLGAYGAGQQAGTQGVEDAMKIMQAHDAQLKKKLVQSALKEFEAAWGPEVMAKLPVDLRAQLAFSLATEDAAGLQKSLEATHKHIQEQDERQRRQSEASALFPTRTQGPVEPVDQTRLAQQRIYGAEGIKGALDYGQAMDPKGEPFTLGQGQTRFDAGGTPIATGGEKEPTSDFSTFAAAGREKGWSNAQISEEWHKLKMAEAEASGKMRGLSFSYSRPAKVWDTKGKVPVYTTVGDMRETNQKEPGRFIPLESAVGFSAMNKSYANIRKQYDMTEQAVKQAEYLGSALMQTSDNFKRSNYPTPNKLIVWASKEVGNPEVQKQVGKFKLALLAFSREYMRVVTGGARSVAELSVTAQQTADDVLSKFDTWEVLQAKLDQAFIEMNGVTQSYQSQMGEIEAELGRSGQLGQTGGISLRNSPPPPAPGGAGGGGPTAVERRTLPNGEVWDKLSDGTFRQVK